MEDVAEKSSNSGLSMVVNSLVNDGFHRIKLYHPPDDIELYYSYRIAHHNCIKLFDHLSASNTHPSDTIMPYFILGIDFNFTK